jgi:hypothetical protein
VLSGKSVCCRSSVGLGSLEDIAWNFGLITELERMGKEESWSNSEYCLGIHLEIQSSKVLYFNETVRPPGFDS